MQGFMEVCRFHKPRWTDVCDECDALECTCGKRSQLLAGCQCSQMQDDIIALLKAFGIESSPERFKGVFQQDHEPCASCSKHVYDRLKKEKARRALDRPGQGHVYQSDSEPESSTPDTDTDSQSTASVEPDDMKGMLPVECSALSWQRTDMQPGIRPIGGEAEFVDSPTIKPRTGLAFKTDPEWKPNGVAPIGKEAVVLESKRKITLQLDETTPWPNTDNGWQAVVLNPGYPALPAAVVQSVFAPFFQAVFPAMDTVPFESAALDWQKTKVKPRTKRGFKSVPKRRPTMLNGLAPIENEASEAAVLQSKKKVELRVKRSRSRSTQRAKSKHAYAQQYQSGCNSENTLQNAAAASGYQALPALPCALLGAALTQSFCTPLFHPWIPTMQPVLH